MKRLTLKDENGCFLTDKTATVTWNSLIGENRYRGEAVDRLAEIEDIISDEDGNYNLDRLTKIMELEKQRSEMLKTGPTVYYVDNDGKIERGVVTSICYDKGRLESFGIEFPESGDFDEFWGNAWGDCFFSSEEEALDRLREGNMEESEK